MWGRATSSGCAQSDGTGTSLLAALACYCWLILATGASGPGASIGTNDGTLVVWGGTVAGITAAVGFVRTAGPRARALLLLPTDHLGGMTTGGLSGIDGPFFPVGGIAAEIIANISNCDATGLRRNSHPKCSTEAQTAAAYLTTLLAAHPSVIVHRQQQYLLGVSRGSGGYISALHTAVASFTGEYFVDASCECYYFPLSY